MNSVSVDMVSASELAAIKADAEVLTGDSQSRVSIVYYPFAATRTLDTDTGRPTDSPSTANLTAFWTTEAKNDRAGDTPGRRRLLVTVADMTAASITPALNHRFTTGGETFRVDGVDRDGLGVFYILDVKSNG